MKIQNSKIPKIQNLLKNRSPCCPKSVYPIAYDFLPL